MHAIMVEGVSRDDRHSMPTHHTTLGSTPSTCSLTGSWFGKATRVSLVRQRLTPRFIRPPGNVPRPHRRDIRLLPGPLACNDEYQRFGDHGLNVDR
jgi:hypothetical protein